MLINFLKSAFRYLGMSLKWFSLVLVSIYCLLIVLLGPWKLPEHLLWTIAAVIFIYLCAIAYLSRGWRFYTLWLIPVIGILLPYSSLKPAMNSNWMDDVARMPEVEIQGDLLQIKNVRNFHYRSETDYDQQYYDQTYDLSKLAGVDLLLTYWGDPRIAHVMLSFRFSDGKVFTCSIETRKEVGESYSAVKGFFKNYELIYVIADERDIVRLRTNFREEDVYLFHLKTPPARIRLLLMNYLARISSLQREPEFYNAATNNCTTNVYVHYKSFLSFLHFNYKVLLSGYFASQAYDLGALDTSLPYEELKKRSHIDAKAQAVTDDQDFSAAIREGLPWSGYNK